MKEPKYILTEKGERISVRDIGRVEVKSYPAICESVERTRYAVNMYLGNPVYNVYEKYFYDKQVMDNFLEKHFPIEED